MTKAMILNHKGEEQNIALSSVLRESAQVEIVAPDKTYRQMGVRLWGVGAYERESIQGIQTKYKALFRVSADDVVVNKIWARNGSVAVVPTELDGCYVSPEFPIFKCDTSKLSPAWFAWLCRTKWFWAQCEEKSHGTSGKNRIKPEKFLQIQIPLPSLAEQKQVAMHLQNQFQKVREVNEKLILSKENSKQLRQAILGEAFDGGFTHDGTKGWIWRSLADILLKLESGGRPKGGARGIETGVPSIGGEHLTNQGGFNFKKIRYVPIQFAKSMKRGQITAGDILIVKDGATTGKTSFVSDDFPYNNAVLNEHVFRLVVSPTIATQRYIFFFLMSYLGQQMINDSFKGSAQGGINQSFVEKVRVPIPSIPEQCRIVAKIELLLSRVDTMEKRITSAIEKIIEYERAILTRAFPYESVT